MKCLRRLLWGLGFCFWGLVGCGLLSPLPADTPVGLLPTPTLMPTFSPAPAPTATLTPDTGWVMLRPGLERREIRIFSPDPTRAVREQLYLLRLEPEAFRFDVAYRPGDPQTLLDWQAETGALVVLNGGFFTEEYIATGLVITNSIPTGTSYGPFAGMFAVSPAGPQVRWLQTQPYDPNEVLLAGLQSFPVLVKPGGVLGFPEEDGQAARRTVIGQDGTGRIIVLVAPRGYFTLHQLSEFLVNSDLQLNVALNLDGGPSSGILVADPAESVFPQAFVPTVITVYPR